MKGLILCAGKGIRLRPFSLSKPKALLQVANKPILYYCIEKLIELGIKEIGIVIHPQYKQMFIEEVGLGEKWNANIAYIDQEQPLGISDAVLRAESFIMADPFLLLLGDNLIAQSLKDLQDSIVYDQCEASILLGKVTTPQDYGIAEVVGERIVGLEEKPLLPKSNLAVLGAYAFNSRIFQAVRAIAPSKRGEYEITDAIQWMINNGNKISFRITDQKHSDVGTPDRWLEANRWMLELMEEKGELMLQKQLNSCTILPPVLIDPSCELKDCVIGPYVSIGPHVRLEGCYVKNSIVLEGTNICRPEKGIDLAILDPLSVITLRPRRNIL